MQNINFDDGIKTYMLNNDESTVIRVNTSDYGIVDRFDKVKQELEKLADKADALQSLGNADESEMKKLDSIIREKVNYIFGSDVSTPAFGCAYCFSRSNGMPVFANFVNAIMPVIEKEMKLETEKMQLNISKYTNQLAKITGE